MMVNIKYIAYTHTVCKYCRREQQCKHHLKNISLSLSASNSLSPLLPLLLLSCVYGNCMCKTQMKKFPDWYRPPWSGGWMINILASASSQGYNQPPVRGTTSQGYNQPPVRCTTSHGYNQSGVQPATIQGYNQPPVRGTTSH